MEEVQLQRGGERDSSRHKTKQLHPTPTHARVLKRLQLLFDTMTDLPVYQLPAIVDEGPQHKCRCEMAAARKLRRKFQTKAPLRTPLPAVEEEETSTDDETSKWEIPICSRKNVHKPRRRGSMEADLLGDMPEMEMKKVVIANPAA